MDFEYISKNFDCLLGKLGVKVILVFDCEMGNVLKIGGNMDLFCKESFEFLKLLIFNDVLSDGVVEFLIVDREGVVEFVIFVWNYVDVIE